MLCNCVSPLWPPKLAPLVRMEVVSCTADRIVTVGCGEGGAGGGGGCGRAIVSSAFPAKFDDKPMVQGRNDVALGCDPEGAPDPPDPPQAAAHAMLHAAKAAARSLELRAAAKVEVIDPHGRQHVILRSHLHRSDLAAAQRVEDGLVEPHVLQAARHASALDQE